MRVTAHFQVLNWIFLNEILSRLSARARLSSFFSRYTRVKANVNAATGPMLEAIKSISRFLNSDYKRTFFSPHIHVTMKPKSQENIYTTAKKLRISTRTIKTDDVCSITRVHLACKKKK